MQPRDRPARKDCKGERRSACRCWWRKIPICKQSWPNAEKTVREISEDKPKKEQEMAGRKAAARTIASAARREPETEPGFEKMIADLRSQLDEASGELAKAKLTGANAEETARLTKENEMLRDDRGAGTAGRSAARAGQEVDAGRVRQAEDQIRRARSADRTARPADHQTDARKNWRC